MPLVNIGLKGKGSTESCFGCLVGRACLFGITDDIDFFADSFRSFFQRVVRFDSHRQNDGIKFSDCDLFSAVFINDTVFIELLHGCVHDLLYAVFFESWNQEGSWYRLFIQRIEKK